MKWSEADKTVMRAHLARHELTKATCRVLFFPEVCKALGLDRSAEFNSIVHPRLQSSLAYHLGALEKQGHVLRSADPLSGEEVTEWLPHTRAWALPGWDGRLYSINDSAGADEGHVGEGMDEEMADVQAGEDCMDIDFDCFGDARCGDQPAPNLAPATPEVSRNLTPWLHLTSQPPRRQNAFSRSTMPTRLPPSPPETPRRTRVPRQAVDVPASPDAPRSTRVLRETTDMPISHSIAALQQASAVARNAVTRNAVPPPRAPARVTPQMPIVQRRRQRQFESLTRQQAQRLLFGQLPQIHKALVEMTAAITWAQMRQQGSSEELLRMLRLRFTALLQMKQVVETALARVAPEARVPGGLGTAVTIMCAAVGVHVNPV